MHFVTHSIFNSLVVEGICHLDYKHHLAYRRLKFLFSLLILLEDMDDGRDYILLIKLFVLCSLHSVHV